MPMKQRNDGEHFLQAWKATAENKTACETGASELGNQETRICIVDESK